MGAFQASFGSGGVDAFVTKLNPAGGFVYSTYLGGSGADAGESIAVDTAGNAYVTGFTSGNFPTTAGAFQTTFGGGSFDAFVTKLNPAGSALVYSTYLGGSSADLQIAGDHPIAVDAAGNAYVTGRTSSSNFPTANPIQFTFGGGSFDGFVTKLNPSGSSLVYSTYLGGSGFDSGFGIAVDTSGNAYVTGLTDSSNFPTTVGTFQTALAGGIDAFVAKIGLPASTQLCTVTITEGGWMFASNNDKAMFHGVAMSDAQGNVSGDETYRDLGPAQPMTVDSTKILAITCSNDRTTASVFGEATIDGSRRHVFRIDVVDGGNGGSNDKYGISLDTGYMSGVQPLQGGNVTIH